MRKLFTYSFFIVLLDNFIVITKCGQKAIIPSLNVVFIILTKYNIYVQFSSLHKYFL